MKRILLGVIAAFSLSATNAQTLDTVCLTRYKDQIFDSVTKVTYVYSTTNKLIDIYTPVGDTVTSRPAIIWVHGGTFITGTRNDGDVVELAQRFAKRGYVTASIDYSLAAITQMTDSNSAFPPVIKAVLEGKAAVRYLRLDSNAAQFGIDTSNIFLGGSSAGAVLAVNLAFLDTTAKATPLIMNSFAPYIDVATYGDTLEGNLGNPGPSSHVQAVISLAGGILNTNWIDGHTNIPVVLCQGDSDNVVPYTCGKVLGGASNIVLCGSNSMAPAFDAVGEAYARYDFTQAGHTGHVPWDSYSGDMDIVDTLTANFLYNYVPHYDTVCHIDTVPTTGIRTIENNKLIAVYPNPAQSVINISVENNAVEISAVRVFNVLGQTAYNGSETRISTTAMQNGIYFVEVLFKNNERAVKRVEVLR